MQISSIAAWLVRLFDPPPLASLSWRQKAGRAVLISVSLVTLCVIAAMVLAAGIFLVQRTPDLWATIYARNFSMAAKMAGIVVLSIGVNAICVGVLLQVRRLDRELMDGQRDLHQLLRKNSR